jgi:hypothetical protein
MNIGSYASANLSGLEFKKDLWNGELSVKTNTFEGMMVLDLTKISGLNSSNTALPIEFKRDRVSNVALIANEDFKSKFSIADIGSTLKSIQLAGAFKMYGLSQFDIPEITIKKVGYVEPVKVEPKNVNLCENYSMLNGLPVKIVLFNPNGVCFKVATNGKKVNEAMCSNVEFDCEYGTNVLTIALSNGQTITDKIYPSEGDVYIVYEIMERKGEWRLNRKLDLSGDARKTTTTKLPTTTICKDYITLNNEGMNFRADVTITKITKDRVYYMNCKNSTIESISKMDILAIEYANKYYDKFDYSGRSATKINMDLERTELEVIELRNSTQTSSSFIIGPNR